MKGSLAGIHEIGRRCHEFNSVQETYNMSHSDREGGRCMLNGENSLIITEMIMKPDAIATILMPVEEAMNQKNEWRQST